MLEILISPEVVTVTKSPLVTVGYLIQLLVSLAIVIGLIYFAAKYLLPKIQLPSSGSIIKVIDRIGLEPQVSAYIIGVYAKTYLVVISNKNATLIDKIEDGA